MRASNGQFAAFVNKWYAEYIVNKQPCKLAMVGKFREADVGFAVANGSPLKERMDKALSELKKSGEVESLKRKWWKRVCVSASDTHRANLVTFVTIVFILVLSMTTLY